MVAIDPYDLLIAKLATRAVLDDDDRTAIRSLVCTIRPFAPHAYLVREGERPVRCALLLSGFAFRQKLTSYGGRQILSVMIPGDFTDLQQIFLTESDHNVQALTRLEAAEIAIEDLRALSLDRPAVARALWTDALIEASIMRETILNIGRRDGPTRLAHLLCEFQTRLRVAGLADPAYDLPMTQEQLGDATGLTAVHVNRTLKQLEREGLILRSKRQLRIIDWPRLVDRADFGARYLHLNQTIGPG